ncbi:phasin family protein [Bradyrhizobium sp. CNPSo 4010]|uniref:Phasin family protein n=1 Tax=Bradyrhizobium agreste TaxID=2751811 RepID=A0ABS0PVC1_9BRAD|nr:phasin family protein [Bradyrhizobium agreste]MBH5401151.1 phasin family protein [Bradyrhizobium agreste]
MSKTRSRSPANDARAKRRSLVELTAAASRSAEKSLLGMSTSVEVSSGQDRPSVEQAAAPASISASAASDAIRAHVERANDSDNAVDTIDMSVEIAKDMQTRVLEGLKLSMHAALDYTKNLTRTQRPTDEDANAAETAAGGGEKLDPRGSAAECRAVVLELMKVNAGATLAYVREVGQAKTLSEFVELSSSHARKQCELVLKQTEVLKLLAQNVAKPRPE